MNDFTGSLHKVLFLQTFPQQQNIVNSRAFKHEEEINQKFTPWSSLRTPSPGPPLLMNSSRTLLMTSSMT